jgi:hypothetical protein
MTKTTIRKGEKKMAKFVCSDVSTQSGKTALQKSVERLIQQNKKVFDNLAKS